MFKASVAVNIPVAKIAQRIEKNTQHAQAILDNRIIRDTDPFVPMDTGMLASSVRRATNYGTGRIIYNMPYARRMYYGIKFKFSRDKHPKATHHWLQKSKSIYMDAWGRAVAAIYKGIWRRGK